MGHKQLTANPWDSYEEKLGVNKVIEAEVIDIYDRGVLVDLGNAIEGFVPKDMQKKKMGLLLVRVKN